MSDSAQLQELVARVVAEVFDARLPALRAEVAQRVAEELKEELEKDFAAGAPSGGGTGIENPAAPLNAAAVGIQNGASQSEILSALLEGCGSFAGRAALFVLRGNSAVGWKARNLDENFVKQFTLDPGQGLAARALRDRTAASAAAAEFSSEFVASAGNPSDGNCIV